MPFTIFEATVIAVHGEGDRAKAKAIADHEAFIVASGAGRRAVTAPLPPSDPAPEVLVVLRDEPHELRLEVPLRSWDQVEAAKAAIGWDAARGQFVPGAKVQIAIG